MAVEVKKRRIRGQTRLSSKNQLTIPVDVVRQAGLEQGERLRVAAEGPGKIVIERETEQDRERTAEAIIDRYAGMLTGVYHPGYLDELRDEWD